MRHNPVDDRKTPRSKLREHNRDVGRNPIDKRLPPSHNLLIDQWRIRNDCADNRVHDVQDERAHALGIGLVINNDLRKPAGKGRPRTGQIAVDERQHYIRDRRAKIDPDLCVIVQYADSLSYQATERWAEYRSERGGHLCEAINPNRKRADRISRLVKRCEEVHNPSADAAHDGNE